MSDEAIFFLPADTQQRARNEAAYYTAVRSYVRNERKCYTHGGVVNALSVLAQVCEERSERDCDDWSKAASLISDLALSCDLRYRTGSTDLMFEEDE